MDWHFKRRHTKWIAPLSKHKLYKDKSKNIILHKIWWDQQAMNFSIFKKCKIVTCITKVEFINSIIGSTYVIQSKDECMCICDGWDTWILFPYQITKFCSFSELHKNTPILFITRHNKFMRIYSSYRLQNILKDSKNKKWF